MQRVIFFFLLVLVTGGVVAQNNLEHHRLAFYPSQPDPGPRPIRFSDNHYFYNFTADEEKQGGNVRQKEEKPHPVYNKKRDNNVFSVKVTPRSIEESELRTESSFIQGNVLGGENVGRTGFLGGGGGYQQCQNLNSFNPGCCNQGYINCCGGGGNQGWKPPHRPLPPIFNPGWKSPQHHHQRPPIIAPPIHRPHPPPQHYHHPHPPPPTFGGGWQTPNKPGSCQYKSPLSFLHKFNIFSKGNDHHQDKGWGWDPHPPSQNAGYHFYRRSDTYPHILSKRRKKRQLDIPNYQQQDKQTYQESGRIFGWGSNNGISSGWSVNTPRCFTDRECPSLQKCCQGVCKTPNFFNF